MRSIYDKVQCCKAFKGERCRNCLHAVEHTLQSKRYGDKWAYCSQWESCYPGDASGEVWKVRCIRAKQVDRRNGE